MFYCRFCEDEFSSSKELKKHEKNCECNPVNASREKLTCRYCKKAFSDRTLLSKHQAVCEFNPANNVEVVDEEE